MKKLILVRHGQSEWNLKNLFTGWTDVDLTEQGIQEAKQAGKTLLQEGIEPQMCFTSYLKRAIKTLNNILDAMNMDYLPVEKSWRLNEKSCGDLQGKNKPKRQKSLAKNKFCCGEEVSMFKLPHSLPTMLVRHTTINVMQVSIEPSFL